jgi:hypothetical protein
MNKSQLTVAIQPLEPRVHLAAAPPQLIGQQLLGDLPWVTRIVLTFDGPLDPASAQNKFTYHLYRRDLKYDPDSWEDSFHADNPEIRLRVPFSGAVYNDADHTVTLKPRDPFRANLNFRFFFIDGTGPDALRTPDGEPIGARIKRRYISRTAKHIRFRDGDGDMIRFDLKGKGAITTLRRNDPQRDPIVYLTNTDAASVFTATLIPGKNGDGHLDVFQFNANGVNQQNFTTNPAFSIVTVNP